MRKVLKYLFISLFCAAYLVPITGWVWLGYELNRVPDDEHILFYVGDLMDQEVDGFPCRVIEKEFSTNIREYSLYTVIQFETEFSPVKESTDLTAADQEMLAQLLNRAFGHTVLQEDMICFADREEGLYYIYSPEDKTLVLDYV